MSGKTITSFRAREPVPREGNGRDWLRSDETEGETVETYDLSSWLVLICIGCLFRDIRKQVTHHILLCSILIKNNLSKYGLLTSFYRSVKLGLKERTPAQGVSGTTSFFNHFIPADRQWRPRNKRE